MRKITSFAIISAMLALMASCGNNAIITSPDGNIVLKVSADKEVTYTVKADGVTLLNDSHIAMEVTDLEGNAIKTYGKDIKPSAVTMSTVENQVEAKVYRKSVIQDNYTQLTLEYSDYNIVFRAYNNGVAYRFESKESGTIRIKSEEAEFNMAGDWTSYVPYANVDDTDFNSQVSCSFENRYQHIALSEWDKERIAFLPVLIDAPQDMKVLITESDLRSYPGMFLSNWDQDQILSGKFAQYPDQIEQGGHNMLQGIVKTRHDYLADRPGTGTFPWRIIAISQNDVEMADNDLVYLLGKEADPKQDFSWVRPGKVAWEWWNDWNIRGVDFQPGVNTKTYKHYIDFASENNIEYVILDEGWSVNLAADLYQIVPEIDLEEILSYAESRNVGIILWAGYWALNRDIEGLCKHYSQMGVKGFKIDFMDRDDQMIIDFIEETAAIASKYKLMVDFHGTSKPSGLHRTYPNIINYEGIHGLEQMKWSSPDVDEVTYDVTIPYIRFMAGPADYTQGAMHNAAKGKYRPDYHSPMSQGTRCHQLAEYIVFSSPLNMLCDSPSNYRDEPECTGFISSIPTVFDETVGMNGKVAEYITIARRSGDVWYVGSLNGWDERNLTLDLSFLESGNYTMQIFADGTDANQEGTSYTQSVQDVPSDRKVNIHLAQGGGWIARIVEK